MIATVKVTIRQLILDGLQRAVWQGGLAFTVVDWLQVFVNLFIHVVAHCLHSSCVCFVDDC